MSEDVAHFGTAKKLDVPKFVSWEMKMEHLELMGFQIDDWDEKYIDCEDVIYIDSRDEFYQLITHIDSEYECAITEDTDGLLTFSLRYYDGGLGFEEAFEYALDHGYNKD